jgi:hypothetical protein
VKAQDQNFTIEHTFAPLGDGGRGVEITGGMNDGGDSNVHVEINRRTSAKCDRVGPARFVALRPENMWQLNEESRREANEANAGRRPGSDWPKNAKPAEQPTLRAERTEPIMRGTNAAQAVSDSAELVNAGSEPTVRAGPAYGYR